MEPVRFSRYNEELLADDPSIKPLPVLACTYPDNTTEIISCWKPTFWERLKVLFTGKVFVHILCKQHPPLYVSTDTKHIKEIDGYYDELIQQAEESQWN